MKKKTTIKLPLTDPEKQKLRAHKVKMADILNFAVDELAALLDIPMKRAKEIHALAEFQTIPSIGIRFAEDLVFLKCYAISELKGKDAASLLNEYERKKGHTFDPCLEDQFRLAVHYANTGDATKNWWDFTGERKKFRLEHGYPANRPTAAWYDHRD